MLLFYLQLKTLQDESRMISNDDHLHLLYISIIACSREVWKKKSSAFRTIIFLRRK